MKKGFCFTTLLFLTLIMSACAAASNVVIDSLLNPYFLFEARGNHVIVA